MSSLRPDRDDLLFQCKDLLARDIFLADTDSDSRSESSGERVPRNKLSNRRYQILLFGNTAEGTSVTLCVENFTPFFYVRIPDVLARSATAHRNLRTWLLHGVPVDAAESTQCEVETHKTLMDYNGGAAATFMKVTTPSQALWRALRDRLLTKSTSTPIEYESRSLFGAAAVPLLRTSARSNDVESLSEDGSRIKLKVYEANIDPVLRYFHIVDCSPAGWIRVPAGDWDYASSRDAKTDIVASCEYSDVTPGSGAIAPYLIGSWDIECNSSHGDFPLAMKTWRKPVREMFETTIPDTVADLCTALADAVNGTGTLSKVYLKRPLTGAVNGDTFRYMLEGKGCKDAVSAGLSALQAAVGHKADVREAAFKALDDALTAGLPTVAGDEIIQIGTVLYRRGAPVSKHIWVLGSVDEAGVRPPGAEVPISAYPFTEEVEMIKDKIVKM
jgi:hypothetical protein